MRAPDNTAVLTLEDVERRYGALSDCADTLHARALHKERRETSTEQHANKPSLHRKRLRRHVQMIAIATPHAEEFRDTNPEQLLARGLATKTAHAGAGNAFRPIKKKRCSFERNTLRSLKEESATQEK